MDELFRRELVRMMVSLDAFFTKYKIAYSLSCGTLLGAVRHHGFIPWDDDLDIMMSRGNFERFAGFSDELRSATGLVLSAYQDLPLSKSPIVKVVDPRIGVQPEHEAAESSLWIDVFPVDGLPESSEKVARVYRQSKRLRSVLYLLYSTRTGSTPLRTAMKTLIQPLKLISPLKVGVADRLNSLSTSTEYGSTPYVGNIAWGTYGPGERISLAGFEKTVRLPFEGYEFCAMSNWDEYLTGIYGDYMQVPPEEQRVSHGIKAWWREKPANCD